MDTDYFAQKLPPENLQRFTRAIIRIGLLPDPPVVVLNGIPHKVVATGLDQMAYKIHQPGRVTPFDGVRSATQPGVVIVMRAKKSPLFFDEKTLQQLPQGASKYQAALPGEAGPHVHLGDDAGVCSVCRQMVQVFAG